jgi:hypothetical protein
MNSASTIFTALLVPVALVAADSVISPDKLRGYVERFDADDRESTHSCPTTLGIASVSTACRIMVKCSRSSGTNRETLRQEHRPALARQCQRNHPQAS